MTTNFSTGFTLIPNAISDHLKGSKHIIDPIETAVMAHLSEKFYDDSF